MEDNKHEWPQANRIMRVISSPHQRHYRFYFYCECMRRALSFDKLRHAARALKVICSTSAFGLYGNRCRLPLIVMTSAAEKIVSVKDLIIRKHETAHALKYLLRKVSVPPYFIREKRANKCLRLAT